MRPDRESPDIDTVVIGAGQAGLAVSRCLSDRGVEHVVLERGRVAERWRSERWDSLRLLTPNWMSRLPGWSYTGSDPHGFMTAAETTQYFQSYADASAAPVHEHTEVEALDRDGDTFTVATSDGRWRAATVVIATGWCDRPAIPAMAHQLAGSIAEVAPSRYRNPDSLPSGGVLVVGASASGAQLADELVRSGRSVVLAAGRHTRIPRRYRGMDIFWWLDRIGNFDQTIDDLADTIAAQYDPSLQLVGGPEHRNLDLTTLAAAGVELTGRLTGLDGHRATFAADLDATVAEADAGMRRLLGDIDRHIRVTGLGAEVLDAEHQATLTPQGTRTAIDLRARGITSVIWATGHRRAYPWLHLPALDERGEIRQYRGVTPVPGLYVLGQRFQHHRSSNFIDGVGRDAAFIADRVAELRRSTAITTTPRSTT